MTKEKLGSAELRNRILEALSGENRKGLTPKQIINKLNIGNSRKAVNNVMEELEREGKLRRDKNDNFQIKQKAEKKKSNKKSNKTKDTHKVQDRGRVDMTRSGSAYIVRDHAPEDVYVTSNKLKGALHGDYVEIKFKSNKGRRPKGAVVKVLERARESFIGALHRRGKNYFVIPTDVRTNTEILVDPDSVNPSAEGQVVVARVESWPTHPSEPMKGKVVEVLGEAGESDVEMKAILMNNGFRLDFPKEVILEAESFSLEIDEKEILRRRDMRDITTFTIDPADAKDFDDALSLRKMDNGNLEVGIHIADVTYYVREDTALDKEAYKRSTSVYLVDRVLPMLPENLSNGVCSLRPHEDKLTMSTVFEFTPNFKLVKKWFGKSVIHSDRRYTYEEAQEVIDSGKGEFAEELKVLNNIARHLREHRFKFGSIAFEMDEVQFELNKEGVPIDIYLKERKDAHLLVEDFMLLANKEVPLYIDKKEKKIGREIPFVYRIHDEPDMEKVADFAKFAKEMGYTMNAHTPKDVAKAYNRLTELSQEEPQLRLLVPLAVRTMAKAEYNIENIGHYGLGFDYYTHFTSPIRRYSDVLVHRILYRNLNDSTYIADKEELSTECSYISVQERKAMDAERESVKYKQVEYLKKKKGEIFQGVVISMADFGVFVQLKENYCEGMIRWDAFDEPYQSVSSHMVYEGKRTGNKLSVGDELKVRVIGTNLDKREIDLKPVEQS